MLEKYIVEQPLFCKGRSATMLRWQHYVFRRQTKGARSRLLFSIGQILRAL